MNRAILNNRMVLLLLLVAGLMAFVGGCDEREPEVCAKCVSYLSHIDELATGSDRHLREKESLQIILKESLNQTDRAIAVAEDLRSIVSDLKDVTKATQDELLKANTEIVACWAIIEAAKTEPNTPPVWGQGELPADFQKMFGNDNPARLNYMQNQVLDKHAKIIVEIAKRVLVLEGMDPNSFEVADPNEVAK